jgi:hypothetical protein
MNKKYIGEYNKLKKQYKRMSESPEKNALELNSIESDLGYLRRMIMAGIQASKEDQP